MKQKIFAVYDSVAATHMQPFFAGNEMIAARHFKNAAEDKATDIGRNPLDYTLFEIGEFDTATGSITAHDKHINMGPAASFIKE